MEHKMPFDEDIMTLIMGVSPEEPGQHGRTQMPMPSKDAIDTITQIRDLCDAFLSACDKGEGEEEKETKPKKDKGFAPEEKDLEESEEKDEE